MNWQRDYILPTMAAFILIIYGLVQFYILTHVIPVEMRDIVMRSLGTLDAALGLILAYFFGSSNGSEDKNQVIQSLSQK